MDLQTNPDKKKKRLPSLLLVRHWEWCHFLKGFPVTDTTERRSQRSERSAERFPFFSTDDDLPAVVTLVCKFLYLLSSSHTYTVMCRHIDQISMNLSCCWNPLSPAHGAHVVYQSALTAAPQYYKCCNTNTCTSVQQWSINNNSNN